MDTRNIKLFDANDELVSNFDEIVSDILISVHGEKYYDTDEVIKNTEEIKIIEEEVKEIKQNKEEKNDNKTSIKDFIPVIFFILIATLIIIAGFYFLNTANLKELIK